MLLSHLQTILPPAEQLAKVSSLAWAPNKCVAQAAGASPRCTACHQRAACMPGLAQHRPRAAGVCRHRPRAAPCCSAKLAAAAADKVVHLFDEAGERRDKFKTKPGDGGSGGGYVVRAMAFSPDSTKLAVAQSDSIVFVYRCWCMARWGGC